MALSKRRREAAAVKATQRLLRSAPNAVLGTSAKAQDRRAEVLWQAQASQTKRDEAVALAKLQAKRDSYNARRRHERAVERAKREAIQASRDKKNLRAKLLRDQRRAERGLPPVEPRPKARVRSWSRRPQDYGPGYRMEVFARGRYKDGTTKYTALITWTDKRGIERTGYFRLPRDMSTDDVLDVIDAVRDAGGVAELRDTDADAHEMEYEDEDFEGGIPWGVGR